MTAPVPHSQPTNPDVRHTDTPWTLRQFEHSVVLYGPGKIQVMSTSWHGSIRATYPRQAESLANAAFVLEACNSHASLKARVEELETALRQCVEVLELVERPAFVDPDYGDEVSALGDRIGYGALMSSASASWRERLGRDDRPTGGEFVAGPCFATVVRTLKIARAALPQSSAVARSEQERGK